jgi:chemotaxis protein CheC
MPPASIELTELELDALTELVNIGVSHAANALREMVKEQVLLSVPNVALVDRQRAIEILAERELSTLIAVQQAFEGDINGRALLIFPDNKSLELIRAVSASDLTLEDIIELEQEALAEVGNIILNGCLATIANMLQRNLKMSLPEIMRGEGGRLFEQGTTAGADDFVVFIYINFAMETRDIRGYIAMLMDIRSFATLKHLIGQFIERTAGPSPHADERT